MEVVGEDGRGLPAGEVGEIAVESEFLALGYAGREELTAAAFRDAGGGRRRYLTGDMGRMAQDGCLTHLGRKGSTRKVRGLWVDTAAVEAALAGVAGVAEAAAVVVDRGAEAELVAFVVARDGGHGARGGHGAWGAPAADEMRRALRARLPGAVEPNRFVVVDALPLSANGKVDRRALAERAAAAPAARPSAAYEAPRTPIEEAVAGIWREVLGVEKVGAHDVFADLGGDSLKAAMVASRLLGRLGVRLGPAALGGAGTVAEMALVVAAQLAKAAPGDEGD